MRLAVVQLTPPGSSCSVQLGVGLTDAVPGSSRVHLVVEDIETVRAELLSRGVAVSALRHKAPLDKRLSAPAPVA